MALNVSSLVRQTSNSPNGAKKAYFPLLYTVKTQKILLSDHNVAIKPCTFSNLSKMFINII